jgi:hypothetical protein
MRRNSTALAAHILLRIHRADLAQKEYAAARQWADDSLLIQVRPSSFPSPPLLTSLPPPPGAKLIKLIEAYLGLTSGGRAAQQAYYVYDELAADPAYVASATAVPALVGKAVAMLVQGDRKGAAETLMLAKGLVSVACLFAPPPPPRAPERGCFVPLRRGEVRLGAKVFAGLPPPLTLAALSSPRAILDWLTHQHNIQTQEPHNAELLANEAVLAAHASPEAFEAALS